MNNSNKTVMVIVAVVIAVVIFFGGYKYGESKGTMATAGGFGAGAQTGGVAGATASGRRGGAAGYAGGFGGRGGAASSTVGTILSVDSDSITVSLTGGGSKIVFVSTSTPVMITSIGTLSSLQIGQTVSVQGSTNSDGSVSATAVQVRPAGMTGTRGTGTEIGSSTYYGQMSPGAQPM
jgi:hypothetical protein